MISRTLLLSALALILATACGDDAPAEGNNPTTDASVVRPDAGTTLEQDGGTTQTDGGSSTTTDAGTLDPRVLTLNGTSPQTVYYGKSLTAGFTLTSNGAAVPGARVQFTLQGSGGSLGASSANTSAQGVAQVTFTAGTADADLVLMASADRATPVALSLLVRVDPAGTATVSVSSASANSIPVSRAEISLVATPAGQTAPTCAALLSAAQPPATANVATVQPVPGTTIFNALAHGSALVAYVRGLNAAGMPVALGCAQGATVVGGGNVTMSVVLEQLPSDVTGDYDALVKVDVGNALPQPYEGYLDLFGSLVSNPAGVAMYYALDKVDELSGVTTFIDGATLETVLAAPGQYPTWNTLTAMVDGQIAGSSFGETYAKIKTVGTDVNAIVRSFEVGTRFHVSRLATPGQVQINEKWQAVVYSWGYGCTAGEGYEGCRRNAMQMANTSYAPVNESYGALVEREPVTGQSERFAVKLEPHDIPIRYGAIILLAVNELVVPRVTSCTTCNSVTDLLTFAVNCDTVGTAVSTWVREKVPYVGETLANTILSPTVLAGACNSGLQTAGAYVETKALELVAMDAQQLGTAPGVGSGGTFYLVDADKDLKTELLQELSIDVAWIDPQNPAASQEISAPMTGAGRLAATACGSDLDCATTESCQVIPSYLKVREVETTCKAAVGSLAGNAACTSNAQCRSGLCAAGYCFQACDENVQCSSAVCDPERGLVDLDPVLAGLGDAFAQGCAR